MTIQKNNYNNQQQTTCNPELLSHFIWLGGAFTIKNAHTMLAPIVLNQRAFFQGAYTIKPQLWVDRSMDPAVARFLQELGVTICSIDDLFNLEKLQTIQKYLVGQQCMSEKFKVIDAEGLTHL